MISNVLKIKNNAVAAILKIVNRKGLYKTEDTRALTLVEFGVLAKLCHFDGGDRGLGSLVAMLTSAAVDGLLHIVVGQDAEDDRYVTLNI